jgi:hypothetical protein
MTHPRRPPRRQDSSGPGRAPDERGRSSRSRRGERRRHGHAERWQFATEIRAVGGAEGEWLRRELAGVVGELLVWARDDMAVDVHPDPGDEERAA